MKLSLWEQFCPKCRFVFVRGEFAVKPYPHESYCPNCKQIVPVRIMQIPKEEEEQR